MALILYFYFLYIYRPVMQSFITVIVLYFFSVVLFSLKKKKKNENILCGECISAVQITIHIA